MMHRSKMTTGYQYWSKPKFESRTTIGLLTKHRLRVNSTLYFFVRERVRDKMVCAVSKIPSKIVRQAIVTYQRQEQAPLSPVTIYNGATQYCAAAVILLVAKRLSGKEAGDKFERESMSLTKRDMMKMFDEFGWGGDLCREIFITNDAYPDEMRKSLVERELLPSLLN